MATPDDLERRLSAVEREVARLRAQQEVSGSDAAAARVLAAGADRDVSEVRAELRAHTGALSALRETQLETIGRLDRLEDKVDRLEHKVDTGFAEIGAAFAKVDANFARDDAAFATVNGGMAQIVRLLEERP